MPAVQESGTLDVRGGDKNFKSAKFPPERGGLRGEGYNRNGGLSWWGGRVGEEGGGGRKRRLTMIIKQYHGLRSNSPKRLKYQVIQIEDKN